MSIRHSDTLHARCAPEIVKRVDQAAAKSFMKPGDYVRLAVRERLKRDGVLTDCADEVA
jgi:hypothetical protein